MYCIHLKNSDPYFCLAAEEYFLKNFDEDIFMLWQSNNTVVIGKHQCALAEINYPFIRKNNINVARRISGGGTVFHDAGNVNFTFIQNVESPAEVSFKKLTKPIVDSLAKLNLEVVNSGRNDLLLAGKKISGNAEHIYKNRILHHGTLLFESDLKNLGQAIKVIPGKYMTKAVQSNRSEVTNISDFLKEKMTIEDFITFLIGLQLEDSGSKKIELNKSDISNINQLVEEKFNTWEWNFGYSPKYEFTNEQKIDGKNLKVDLKVEKGIVTDSKIAGGFFSNEEAGLIAQKLLGVRHSYEELSGILNGEPEELIYSFF